MAPINLPDGTEVSEVILPDGATASEVIAPDGSTVFGPIPDSALAQDLVAWYRFEDGDARDYASSAEFPNVTWGDSTAFNGTINGATFQSGAGVTDFENGQNSAAFDFDGNNDEIRTGLTTNFTNSQTLHAWIKPQPSNNTKASIISKAEFFANTFDDFPIFLFVNAVDDKIAFELDSGDNFAPDVTLTEPVVYDTFQHVVASYQANGTCELIVDGSVADSATFTGSISSNSLEYVIGNVPFAREGGVGETEFNGVIDDARIYNRNISQAEALDIFNNTKP